MTVGRVIIRSGAIDAQQLREFEHWRTPLDLPAGEDDLFDSSEEAAEAIDEVLESKSAVEVRTTDPEALRYFKETKTRGRLHLVTAAEKGSFSVLFGRTPWGDLLIPWSHESLAETLTNGESYLQAGGVRYYFQDVQELYFGEEKAFIQCTPRAPEVHHGAAK